MKPIRQAFAVFVCAACALAASAAMADSVMPVNAAQMTEKSELVISGRCISSRPEVKNDINVTTSTFEVLDVVKGKVDGSTFTFSQFVFRGAPSYEPGREYILFLTPESKLGLRSPVGLGQGKFMVLKGMAINERNNRGLFTGLPDTKKTMKALSVGGVDPKAASGPISAKSLVDVVKGLDAGR
ncbi:MAG TPA: hypothetical protein PLZ86_04065 [bacterium]|nr:hypothetical protein [bacterium]